MSKQVSRSSLRTTAGINALLGIWLFLSPWIYNASRDAVAWNSFLCGALIALFAGMRAANPERGRGLSMITMFLGAWVFISPWALGFAADSGRGANNMIVGALVFLLGVYGSGAVAPDVHHHQSPHPQP